MREAMLRADLDLSSTIGEQTAEAGNLLANLLDSTAAAPPVGYGDFDTSLFNTPPAYSGPVPAGNLDGFEELWTGVDNGRLPVPPPLDLSHLGAAANPPSIDDDDWLRDYKVPDVNKK